jgi:hypothetical protein
LRWHKSPVAEDVSSCMVAILFPTKVFNLFDVHVSTIEVSVRILLVMLDTCGPFIQLGQQHSCTEFKLWYCQLSQRSNL